MGQGPGIRGAGNAQTLTGLLQRLVKRYRLPLLYLCVTIFLAGFSGCGGGPQINTIDEKTGEVKPNFELKDSTPLPGNHQRKIIVASNPLVSDEEDNDEEDKNNEEVEGDANTEGDAEEEDDKKKDISEPDPENWRVKPNHWVTIQNEGISKKEDFSGVLKHSMWKANDRPKQIPGTRYFLRTQRPASLAKEQPKKFESPIFVTDHDTLTVIPQLETTSGSPITQDLDRLLPLEDYQYHMVLLTDAPLSYQFLKFLPSIWNVRLNQSLSDELMNEAIDELDWSMDNDSATQLQIKSLFYKLTISDWKDAPELPSNVQQWTSIAYLIWSDDYDPNQLSPDQQQAIVDWLHFGGQIIVCGDATTNLANSFLEPYLPVEPTGKVNSDGIAMTKFAANWSLRRDLQNRMVSPVFTDQENMILTTWKLRPDGREIEKCEGLVAEKSVGKGRVVSVAFPLNHIRLRSWTGLDNWFNACLLRRPGRQFTETDYGSSFELQESSARSPAGFNWTGKRTEPDTLASGRFTGFRLLARDLGSKPGSSSDYAPEKLQPKFADPVGRRIDSVNTNSTGGWNDYSQISSAARATLKDQAGITPPKREWVLKALLIYLAVLVPANYLVFRLLGRLEFAWFSVPIISVIGGIAVVRAAALDIGFSNKKLQVNVIEFAPGYQRAHITGYGSLYSSLTSSFHYNSENPSTVALPFPTQNASSDADDSTSLIEEAATEFNFQYGKEVRFGPQNVLSNTLEMYHYEQFADLGGPFQLLDGDTVISNFSSLNLQDVFLLRCISENQFQFATLPKLDSESDVSLNWKPFSDAAEVQALWSDTCFADYTFELRQLLTRMADAEIPIESTSWTAVMNFYQDIDPKFSSSLRVIAERHQIPPDSTFTGGLLLEAYRESRVADEIHLGRFSRLLTEIPLGAGEARMFGWSDQEIGDFQVAPSASQARSRSFVVAHLTTPEMPSIGSDKNLAYPPKNQKDTDDFEELE